jgi:hypothetical protein
MDYDPIPDVPAPLPDLRPQPVRFDVEPIAPEDGLQRALALAELLRGLGVDPGEVRPSADWPGPDGDGMFLATPVPVATGAALEIR